MRTKFARVAGDAVGPVRDILMCAYIDSIGIAGWPPLITCLRLKKVLKSNTLLALARWAAIQRAP